MSAPVDWQGVNWTGAVEVHVSWTAVATILRARDQNAAACVCGGDLLPPTIMGRPLMINPQLPRDYVEIVYANGESASYRLGSPGAPGPDIVPTGNRASPQASEA